MIWCLCFPFVEADTVSQIEIVFLSPETASRNLPEVFSSLINSDVQEPHSELQAGNQSHINREKFKCLSLNCSWQIRAGAGISRWPDHFGWPWSPSTTPRPSRNWSQELPTQLDLDWVDIVDTVKGIWNIITIFSIEYKNRQIKRRAKSLRNVALCPNWPGPARYN